MNLGCCNCGSLRGPFVLVDVGGDKWERRCHSFLCINGRKWKRLGWDDHAADPTKRECMGCFESSRHKARREFSRSLDVTVQRGEEPKP
jgi:hypothetical protein